MERSFKGSQRPNPSFFTNHALVLMIIGSDTTMRMREVAQKIGITERAVQRIVDELVASGYLVIEKSGRRNMYTLRTKHRVHFPLSRTIQVGDLLSLGGIFGDQRQPSQEIQ